MKTLINIIMPALILCAGALFGFFYTMSISIMPGLDLTPPYSAILANQQIGHATQNYYFALAMIGTPFLAIICAIYHFKNNRQTSILLLLATASWVAMLVVTLTLNVPLNQILDGLTITADQPELTQLWAAYSVDWQNYNWLRVLFSGLTLICATLALKANST